MALDPGAFPGLIAAGATLAGMAQALAGCVSVWRFRRQPGPGQQPGRKTGLPGHEAHTAPPVSVLKPLHGDEPLLEQALTSFCLQDYPVFQIVFGLQDPADPALHVIRRLRARFPDRDIAVVIDPTPHGTNRKVANLINMQAAAKHDILVISDSDIHVAPDYLRGVVATLAEPGTGLVTSLYAGLPANPGLAAQLGATQINHAFLPGTLMARGLGRDACLGATMAIRRETLDAVGGLASVMHELADDAVLGMRVNGLGLDVRLAPTVPATTVPETAMSDLFRHELRWGRTIQSLAPIGYALSALQYPIFWALLSVAFSGGAPWSLALFAAAWGLRAGAALFMDGVLRLASVAPIWLFPLRDVLSVTIILASYGSDNVHWRGQVLSATRPRFAPTFPPIEG